MREDILQFLKNNRGEWVSGEEIRGNLAVSRTAVWKHINHLRGLGYEIEAQPRTGYRLQAIPDRLYPEEIRSGLATRMLGQNIVYLERTTTTNHDAKGLAEDGASEGTLVVAEEQGKGRGRLGRSWFSPYGQNLLFSLILYPQVNPMEAPRFTLLTAVALASGIKKACGISPDIKWPNDLLLAGKKLCGILVELSAEINRVNHLVIGCGINVNVEVEEFPAELKDIATSLKVELGHTLDRVGLLNVLLYELEKLYFIWQKAGFAPILREYRKSCFNLGQPVKITSGKDTWEGVAEDIGDDGALILRLDNGEIRRFIAGEVKLRAK